MRGGSDGLKLRRWYRTAIVERPRALPVRNHLGYRRRHCFGAAQRNDDTTIGAHDANLLFAQRSALTLDRREKAGLVRSGLENFTSENVPLWFWYMQVGGIERGLLSLYSFFREGHRIQANALLAARLIEEPLPISQDWPRELFLKRWFNKDSQSDQKSAAMCGKPRLKK